MRIQTLGVVLLALLCVCRVGDLCGAASRYIETSGLLSLEEIPGRKPHDQVASAALREQRSGSLERGIQSGIEIAMLGGVGLCFFGILKRRKDSAQATPA